MTSEKSALDEGALSRLIGEVIEGIRATGGLEIAADPLSTWREVDRAFEPLAAFIFDAAFHGYFVDADDVMLTLDFEHLDPAYRVRAAIENALDDGQAAREISSGEGLECEAARAASGRVEFCRWEALADDDLSGPAIAMDIFKVARNIQRRLLRQAATADPMAGALAALTGFQSANLPIHRSAWSHARDGAKAGAADFAAETEADAERIDHRAKAVAAALAEGSE